MDYQHNVGQRRAKDDSYSYNSKSEPLLEKEEKKELDQHDFDALSNKSSIARNMFKVKESNDKGLADMETGSEVYMSELLAGFDMEDLDEADEQNEEDLLMLGDSFIKEDSLSEELTKQFKLLIVDREKYNLGKEYVQYCIKQLTEEDQILAKQILVPFFPPKKRQ